LEGLAEGVGRDGAAAKGVVEDGERDSLGGVGGKAERGQEAARLGSGELRRAGAVRGVLGEIGDVVEERGGDGLTGVDAGAAEADGPQGDAKGVGEVVPGI
jgi:hypothetical protein